jgi:orotidine-5'-phosphate decarboxylase
LAVTVLTSLEEGVLAKELGIQRPLQEEVLALARLARAAGLDGVISSPEETGLLSKEFGKDFVLVTPGIRPLGHDPHDQRRSLTPREAIQKGATYLVVGRPITARAEPRQVVRQILQSLA